jgi:hypothetical protein
MENKDLNTTYCQHQGPPPLYEDDGVATAVFEAGRDAALKGQYSRYHQLSHLNLPKTLPLTIKQMTAVLTLT